MFRSKLVEETGNQILTLLKNKCHVKEISFGKFSRAINSCYIIAADNYSLADTSEFSCTTTRSSCYKKCVFLKFSA